MAKRRSGLGILFTIPAKAYQKAKRRLRASERFWDKHASGRKGGWRSLPAEVAKKDPANNRDRAVVEVYEFKNRKQARPFTGHVKGQKITIFTGTRVCNITQRTGKKGVTAKCIDGREYVGRSNGEGMWINMRPKKGRK